MTKIEKFYEWSTRLGFFAVYVWFGWPKLFGMSPATLLVTDLLAIFLPFWPADNFLVVFGLLEVIIGCAFLFPKITKFVIYVTFIHLFITLLPLVFLVSHTWLHIGVLNIEGQYIFKNVILISSLLGLLLHEQRKN